MKPVLEKLEQPVELPFLLKKIDLPAFDVPFHFHPELELTYILESSGMRYVGNHVGNFEPGDLVLIGKNLPHFWQNEKNNYNKSRAIVVQFSEHFLGRTFFDKPGIKELRPLLNDAQKGVIIKGKTKQLIGEKLKLLVSLSALDRVLELLSILSIINNSAETEYLSSPGHSMNLSQADCERLNAIYHYLSVHFGKEIRIDEVAGKVANMSVSAFCHFFRKKMNKTFTQFVNEIRIEEANRLLIETDLRITTIGFQCGFQSQSNFYKQFQRINSQSPNQFRKHYH